MLTIGDSVRRGGRLARRPFLRVGGAGLAGLAGLSSRFGQSPQGIAAVPPNEQAARFLRDRSVIFLFMHGGPSQFETFDPKTEGPSNVHAQTGAIATSIPGISFGSTFSGLAKRAHLLNIVRSFVTGDGNHDIKPVVGRATSGANIGSLYARVAGASRPDTAMPTNIALFPPAVIGDAGPAITDFGNFASAGDLGPAYAPLVPGGSAGFQADMQLHLPQDRLGDRRRLLAELDQGKRWRELAALRGSSAIHDAAFDALLRGVSDAFDLGKEDPRLVERYDTAPHFRPESIDKKWNNHKHYADHGQSIGRLLLLARRLCQRGAGFVTVTTSFVWDMHADINNAPVTEGMRYVGAPFDHAVSAFIDDVEAHGLSDKILLVCCGEMGRTPQLNAAGGRDHWGGLAPLLLYGGGLGKGTIVGRSSRDGGEPASDPVTIPDLVGTITRSLLDLSEVRLLDSLPKSLQATLSQGRPIPGLD